MDNSVLKAKFIPDEEFKKFTGRLPDWLIRSSVEDGYIYVDEDSRDNFIANIQYSSVDVRLSHTLKYFYPFVSIDPTKPQDSNMWNLELPSKNLENDQLINGSGPDIQLRRIQFEIENLFFAGVDNEGYFFRVPPLGSCLGNIIEYIGIRNQLEYLITGKSKIARCGLGIEDAGFADPGFHGRMTIEIRNSNLFNPVILRPGMKIGQIMFSGLAAATEETYNDKANNFQDSKTVMAGSGEK